MDAYHHFELDHRRGLMRLTLAGFYTEAAMQDLLAARATAMAELGGPPNGHLMLADIRDMKIQSQEIVDAFRRMLADQRYHSRRLAFVVGSTLARMQLLRALHSRQARTFTSMAEAEAWLFADSDAAAA